MHDDLPSPESAIDRLDQIARPAAPHPGASPGGDDSWLSGPGGSAADRYGSAEVAVSGVDLSQLRRNLRLTPTERVEQMVAFVRCVLPLQGALRRRHP